MFKADQFIITKNLKQLKCLSMGEWINKFLHIHPIEYHSAIKRNEVLDTYNNTDDSQRHYTERKKLVSRVAYHTVPFMLHLRKGKIIATETQ